MTGVLALMAATAVSVDVGWHTTANGGFEYIIQIEPELLDSLKAGTDVFSELPPFLRGVRSYRITIGNAELPHEGTPPAADTDIAQSRLQSSSGEGAAPQSADAEGPALSGPPAGAARPGTATADRQPDPASDLAAAEPAPGQTDPNTKREVAARTAGYQQAIAGGGPAPPEEGSPSNAQPVGYDWIAAGLRDKPWLPLTGAVLALFASLGANLYLVIGTVSLRGRYRSLAARVS